MVDYKKKRVQLQGGGYKYQYYKQYKNGKEKQVEKEEYYSNKQKTKKGGDEGCVSILGVNTSKNTVGTNCFWSGIVTRKMWPMDSNKFISFSFDNDNSGNIILQYGNPDMQSLRKAKYISHKYDGDEKMDLTFLNLEGDKVNTTETIKIQADKSDINMLDLSLKRAYPMYYRNCQKKITTFAKSSASTLTFAEEEQQREQCKRFNPPRQNNRTIGGKKK